MGGEMHLKSVNIKNFRALEDVSVEFDNLVNVIVGPNATGKTTVLEAIRLAKSLLSPRTQNESQQALISIGAVTPHNPQQIIADTIARDVSRPLEIKCQYVLSEAELNKIHDSIPVIATTLIRARMGFNFGGPAQISAFLSSPQGKDALKQSEKEIRDALEKLKREKICKLYLIIDFKADQIINSDQASSFFISFIDQNLPPMQTVFTYFQADRALPHGEQPVQLGSQDANQQQESHNSQPHLKYQRLKNTIFSAVVRGSDSREMLDREFTRIFDGILKGRKLLAPGVNQYGQLVTRVKDTETGRVFDLDAMSSGEKGLILTFLIISQSVVDGGLILLDEPELHLNPAVCRDLLSFLIDNYAKPKRIQAIICSHSPEILAGAFDRDECSLYHLVSPVMLTKVRSQDQQQINDALRRLGTSESEGLLYSATIFVEGDEDVELLEAGFGTLLRRYKIKDLGGRKEIERQIALLQEAEKSGADLTPRYFIFDRDDAPTNLKSSNLVRVLQWQRRCLENYLLDVDVLADLLLDPEVVERPKQNVGEVSRLLQKLADKQLDALAARNVYSRYNFESPGIRRQDIEGKGIDDIGLALATRLAKIKGQVESFVADEWLESFRRDCETEKAKLSSIWEVKRFDECDGKRLFNDLIREVSPKMKPRKFKRRVLQDMQLKGRENWTAIESLIKRLIASSEGVG